MTKHLLYMTNTSLTARIWRSGRISDGQRFQNDEDGWHAFAVYLSHHSDDPVYLLMDLIEEDFQLQTIPHVLGRGRRNMIERRLSQLYHDTPYRHAVYQGREKTGRKDDVMLFNAMTNATLINTWLNVILNQNVPIAGMFSTALLCTSLFHKLHIGKEPTLFISQQSAGLRQNFFHDGYLRFSRLIKLANVDADSSANAIENVIQQEVTKTRQFLINGKLLQREEPLKIVVLDNSEMLQSLSSSFAFTPINLLDAKIALGLKHLPDDGLADTLYLSLLAVRAPANHYTLPNKNYTYLMSKIRVMLYALSAAVLSISLLWSASNTMAAIDALTRQNQLIATTRQFEQQYQRIVENFPQTIDNPHDMKSAVELHELIVNNASSPTILLGIISQAMNKLPQLSLNEINWEVDTADNPSESTSIPATVIGIPIKPIENVVLKGEVLPFQNDYRFAIDSVKELSNALTKNKHIEVTITSLPLDIRSNVPLKGEAGNSAGKASANFELKITWKA